VPSVLNQSRKSRIARKSRRKGKSFELIIAKALAKALGVPANECCRTPNSGALIERSDLRFSDRVRKVFPWYIEAKKREGWSLDGYFNPKWEIWTWYEDACAKARKDHTSLFRGRAGRASPVLVFARNFMQPLVLMSMVDYVDHLSLGRSTVTGAPISRAFNFKMKLLHGGRVYVIVLFSDFLKYVEKVQQ
jgi:hypothetical protein